MNLVKIFADKVDFGFSDVDDGNLDFRFDEEAVVNKRRESFFSREDIDPKSSVAMIAEHKSRIVKVSKEDGGKGIKEIEDAYYCDCLITRDKGLSLILPVADCIPLVLYDSNNEVLAMVHVGVKNFAAGTVSKSIEAMKRIAGGNEIHAVTGPFIKKCCYSFDKIPEHLKVLEGYFVFSSCHPERQSRDLLTSRERDFSTCSDDHRRVSVDLPEMNSIQAGMTECYRLDTESALRDQLITSGVKEKNIIVSNLCSKHDNFPSHRKSQAEDLPESRMLVYARMT